jgi:hypothetical protein
MSSEASWYENASPLERRLFDQQVVLFRAFDFGSA